MAYKLVLAGVELWSNIPCIRFVLEFNFTSRITENNQKCGSLKDWKLQFLLKLENFSKMWSNPVSWCIWVMFGQKIAFPKQDDQWPKYSHPVHKKYFCCCIQYLKYLHTRSFLHLRSVHCSHPWLSYIHLFTCSLVFTFMVTPKLVYHPLAVLIYG